MPNNEIEVWKSVIGKNMTEGNDVKFLIDGWDTFKEFKKAILTADGKDHYIYLLGWSFDGNIPLDGLGSNMKMLLKDASRKNVQIRMMLWRNFSALRNITWIDYLNKLDNGAGILDGNTITPAASHHQKILIVKGNAGLISFCGGVDIFEDRIKAVNYQQVARDSTGFYGDIEGAKGSPYNDVHCKIIGKASIDLLETFIQRWDAHPDHFKIDKDAKYGGKGPLLGRRDLLTKTDKKHGKQFVGIKRTFNYKGKKQNCIVEHSIQSGMIAAIKAAQRFIYIEDQYMISIQAATELCKALKHLQHITILTTASQISDLPRKWELRSNFIKELLKAENAKETVRIFYKKTPNTDCSNPDFGPLTYIHSKVWIFDDQLAVIGSANCNRRGWESDNEVAAFIVDTIESINPSDYSFAQKLRIQLWKKHLGLTKDTDVYNGIEHAKKWLEKARDKSSGVCEYKDEGEDGYMMKKIPFTLIDPGTDNLKPCNANFPESEDSQNDSGGQGGQFGGAGANGSW